MKIVEMTDYEKLGFKCGIEIHQQLDTKKLFCNCPSQIREEKPDIFVKRKMRVVAGELGNVDPAALYEFLKNREITYEAYSDTNCLVELDDEPPHELNAEALDIVLEVALLLNAKPVSELHVMRKTVIDGSNTGGFQRTMLVAMDGFIETSLGKVRIPTICLEEDAARKISEEDGKVTYRLDRLGIPLVEICTMPDIKSADHARETAEILGKILRATRKVKRGLGTIRQDLNVSISGGKRIEVKGVQDLRLISKVVENEVSRQVMLIEVKNELQKRGIKKEQIEKKLLDITEIFKNTGSKIVKNFLDNKGVVLAVKLPGFSGLLKGKLGPELAQYAKISKVKGIFHSDELPAYGISDAEVKAVREKLMLKEKDAFALVAEKPDTVKRALEEVITRCKISFDGVPEETRRAKEDGTTEFMRPLPGSERMYPETDEKFIQITNEKISKIRENLPKLSEELEKEYEKAYGLNKEIIHQIISENRAQNFEEILSRLNRPIFLTKLNEDVRQMNEAVKAAQLTPQQMNQIRNSLDSIENMRNQVIEAMKTVQVTPQQMNQIRNSLAKMQDVSNQMAEVMKKLQPVSQQIANFNERMKSLLGSITTIRYNSRLISRTLLNTLKELQNQGIDISRISDDNIVEVHSLVNEGKIPKELVPEILAEITKNPSKGIAEILKEKGFGMLSKAEIEDIIEKTIKENSTKIHELGDRAQSFILGRVMSAIRGRADPAEIKVLVEKKVK